MKKIDTSITHIRPRFSVVVPIPQQQVLERIKSLVKNAPKNIYGQIIDNHIILDIVGEEAHYWSPQLNFRVEDEDQEQSIIAGLIGPKPGVWTLFVFIYFASSNRKVSDCSPIL